MERGVSWTARYVAFARALASREPALARVVQDEYAAALLGGPAGRLLERGPPPSAATLIRTLSCGLFDHLALRTALIDRALTKALSEGCTQLVLLGAGFDARAHRLAGVERARVFEVDHPATSEVKRARAARLPIRAHAVAYVAADLAEGTLQEPLARAGFDRGERAVFVWEGVTMYLTPRGVETTLAMLGRLAAEDSLLITTYATPELVAAGARVGRLLERVFRGLGEPLSFTSTPERMAALCARAGFVVLSDASPKDAAAHYGIEKQRPTTLTPRERIAVARKRGAAA